MADLEFNIRANFEEIEAARKEIERLRGELLRTTKATDKQVVDDLTTELGLQQKKVDELTSSMSRYATVMSSGFSKKMQDVTREVYSFEMQAESSRRRMKQLMADFDKYRMMSLQASDAGTRNVATVRMNSSLVEYKDESVRYNELQSSIKDARKELSGLQSEYIKYSGSSNGAKDVTNNMTEALGNMMAKLKDVPTAGEGVSSLFQRLTGDAKALTVSLAGGLGLEQLAQRIFSTRSEFQQLEISFSTMLGSSQKAGALMDQLITTAAKTPFDMGSITNGAKQLLAYGTAAEEVNDILVHLGDISAGLNVPLGDLVYLYGTTMAQGRMYTMDLRQFMGRGIPMAEELGKLMGKTTQQVQDAVSKGKVGADLVKKAIIGMTEEGGKFGGLMEKQSATLQGRWSNIEDSVEQMFNELGKKSEGVFGTGLDLIGDLVENWETIVKVIGTAAVAVGTYKASLMAAKSIQKAQNAATLESLTGELNNKLSGYRDEENDYREKNGKNTKAYRSNRFAELSETLADTTGAGDEQTERIVSLKIQEAQADGLISEEMAKQLQTKRDLLVEQQKSLDKERAEYENTRTQVQAEKDRIAREAADAQEAARQNEQLVIAKAEEEVRNKIEAANNTSYGKAILQTRELEKQVELTQKSYDAARDETFAKKEVLDNLDEQIRKQQEIVDLKEKEIVNDDSSVDTTVFGGYEDGFSDNENSSMVGYDEELAKLEELKAKRKEAEDEFNAANENRKNLQSELTETQERLNESQQEEVEIYKELGPEADEIAETVQQGIDIKEGGTTITELATAAEETNTTAKNANTGATNTNTTADVANTTADNVNTTSTNTNTTATNANTTSTNTNTTSTNVNTGALEKNTLGTRLLSGAKLVWKTVTDSVTKSVKGLWAAMRANPITGVLTLVTTAISIFSMFGDEEDDAAKKTEDMGNKAQEASDKVRSLFAVASMGDAEHHKDTINQLKSAYEEYGVKLDETKMKSEDMQVQLEELKKHEHELIGVIEERTIEMERANQLQQAYDDYKAQNDAAFETFKNDSGDGLTNIEKGFIRSTIRQEDIDAMSEYKRIIDDTSISEGQRAEASQKYLAIQEKVSNEVANYMQRIGKADEYTNGFKATLIQYTNALATSKATLEDGKEGLEKCADAAEKTREDVKNLTEAQRRQAAVNSATTKTFKQLNSEVQQVIKAASQKYKIDIKVNYDDSELPAWIKQMSSDQLKRSIAARQDWLSHHKKGDMANINGILKTYEQVAAELPQLLAAGSNRENKPQKSQKEIDKEKKAAEKEKIRKETQEGNREKANKDYDKTIASYSEKTQESLEKGRISQITNSYDKEIEEIKANDEKEKKAIEDGIDKLVEARKKRDQTLWVNSGKNRKGAMWKQGKTDKQYREEVLAETMKDSKGNTIKDSQGNAMTIGKGVEQQIADVTAKTLKATEKAQMSYLESMQGYMKKFGSPLQARQAVEADYDARIKNATNEWDKKSLEKEKEKALADISFESITNGIDWVGLLKGVGSMSTEMLKPMLTQLEAYTQTDEFKGSDTQMQQKIVDLMKELRNYVGTDQSTTWKDLADAMKAFTDSVNQFNEAKTEEEGYQKVVVEADEKHSKGEMSDDDFKKVKDKAKELGEATASAKENMENFGKALNKAADEVKTRPTKIMEKFNAMQSWEGVEGFSELKGAFGSAQSNIGQSQAAIATMPEGTGKEIASAVTTGLSGITSGLGSAMSGIMGSTVGIIAKIPQIILNLASTIKKFVTGILNSFTELLKFEWLSDLVNSILEAVGNLINAIFDLPRSLWKVVSSIVVQGIGGLLNTIIGRLGNIFSFGALSKGGPADWFTNSNAQEVADTTERLTKENERLRNAVDGLKEEMQNSRGTKALSAYSEAEADQKRIIENSRQTLITQMNYHGAHRSNAKAWNKGKNFSSADYANLNATLAEYSKYNPNDENIKRSVASAFYDVMELTPEQMNYIRNHNTELWNKMIDVGEYDKSQYWEEYADLAGSLDELSDAFNESLTDISFDSLEDEFVNTLMDMDSSASTFANNFSKLLMQAVLKSQVSDLLGDDMEKFYKNWAAKSRQATNENRKLSTTEINALKDEYAGIVEKGLKLRDEVADITGYKSVYDQEASTGAFESMSQDTGEELNGRFTAVQIATEGTYQVVQEINQKLKAMLDLDDMGDVNDNGVIKIEAPTGKESLTTTNEGTQKQLSSDAQKLLDQYLEIFEGFSGTSEEFVDAINPYVGTGNHHSLEYQTGMSTEDIVAYFDANRNMVNDILQPNVVETSAISPTMNEDNESFLSANISTMTANVGNIWIAVDEGRTILAQGLLCLQSIDERQETWHKPMLQAFRDLKDMRDKIQTL